MTIYNQVSSNKVRTVFLVLLFMCFFSFVFYIIGKAVGDTTTYFVLGFILSILSGIGSYFFSDRIVLFTTGAKPASKKEYFDFYTVTENLAIAAGLPMPKLYVIQDASPNAFATGRNPKHAVVAATTGILEKLDRRELEGVIAHELSHVKNYDILLSSMVAVLAGTLVFVTDWITRMLWWGGIDDNDRRQAGPFVMIFFIIVLILTPIIATLIQLAISRKREFLADANGALLTRYPEGLAEALEEISADPTVFKHASNATAHLFIVNPFKKKQFGSWLAGLFSTHPPIDERIKILRQM